MIEVHQLCKRYGGKLAVDNLTFVVRPGIVTGFLGPNGAGKSTTMRLILGLDAPTSGTATVNGKPFAEHTRPLHEAGAGRRVTTCGSWPRPPASAGGGSTR
jgi:ABC-2 type transport system ATP-binding protein